MGRSHIVPSLPQPSNYADLSFLFTILTGEKTNEHLGMEYLAVLETDNNTPYFLNLHTRDAPEEQKAFIAMRGEEGWTVGRLKEMTTPKMWSGVVTHPAAWPWQYASAAILWFLKLGQPVSWESFGILVEQIRELDKPTVSAS